MTPGKPAGRFNLGKATGAPSRGWYWQPPSHHSNSPSFVLACGFSKWLLGFYCHNTQSLWFQTSTKGICPSYRRRSPAGSKIPLLLWRLRVYERSPLSVPQATRDWHIGKPRKGLTGAHWGPAPGSHSLLLLLLINKILVNLPQTLWILTSITLPHATEQAERSFVINVPLRCSQGDL